MDNTVQMQSKFLRVVFEHIPRLTDLCSVPQFSTRVHLFLVGL